MADMVSLILKFDAKDRIKAIDKASRAYRKFKRALDQIERTPVNVSFIESQEDK